MTALRDLRAALALAGTAATVLGVVLLPAGRGTAAIQTATASPSPGVSAIAHPSPSESKQPLSHRAAGTTVTGPRMYNPLTGKKFRHHSTVTVSRTTGLTNEMVHVSWTGFTPSQDPTNPTTNQFLYNAGSTPYPVMIAECNTARPRFWSQCYGATNGGVVSIFGPFGPENTAYATTTKKGTGQADVEILISAQNQFLGCGVHHGCSLVIVPAQGGVQQGGIVGIPKDHCADHQFDLSPTDEAIGQRDFASGGCSWVDRIVVPLHFVPAPKFCPIGHSGFTTLGSPMLAGAMASWIGALCAGPNPVAMTYNAAITEPAAVQDVPLGLGDVALTTRPGPTQIGKRTYTYAPVAISAVAVAYWVDNPVNGQPVRTMKLDPRLVAKLVTQSYNFDGDGCSGGSSGSSSIGCDNAVDGNPFSLFEDPEFRRLNPHVQPPVEAGNQFQVPTVEAGHSDMTWQITGWIADNTNAASFMKGQFDPWGMHVNTAYLSVRYPVDSFTAQDSYPVIAHLYSPDFPLSAVTLLQLENEDNGTNWQIDQTGNFPRDPVQIPGERGLFAILDEADAAEFRFPVAELRNDRGQYVAPSRKSMTAALKSMIPTGSNHITETVDFAKQTPGAYPLTMIIYAMVPTSKTKAHKAADIADFLDYVAGPGQHPGLNVGQLPPGYVPLTAKLRAETLHAADLVRLQKGNNPTTKKPSSSSSPGTSGSPSSGSTPTTSNSPAATPTPTTTVGAGVVTVALKNAQTAGLISYALPLLLIFGGLATLGGAASLAAGTTGGAIGGLRRLPRLRLSFRRNK
jgi:hypothetical protein